jgi:hypothetical protein
MAVIFITKKHLSRRTFLRGTGIAVGLPLLDAMIPAYSAIANTAAAPKPRLGFLYLPHGAIMKNWTPATEGSNFELPPILKPLEAFKKQITIVSGLENKAQASVPVVHAVNPATWLSCTIPRESTEPFLAPTVDQLAAAHIGQDTPFPSLEVAGESRGGGMACGRDYGCAYGSTISFRTPTVPLPMESDPRRLLERLFGQGDAPAERNLIRRRTASLLDIVTEDASTLRRSLDSADRARLDDYLDSVREVERRIDRLEAQKVADLQLPNVPLGPTYDQRLNLMFDLLALAYQSNMTRVFTFMMAGEATNMTYNHIGVPDAFHPLSHHQNDAGKIERLVKIQVWHSQQFAKFLTKLSQMHDGENTVLDNTILLYGSNMSNSNLHDAYPLPLMLVGGGAGKVKGNQHLKYPDRTPLANLHLTVLHRAGVPVEKVGDSTNVFSEV